MSAEKKESVILQTSDDEQFTVEKKVAERSAMIKSMLEGKYRAHTIVLHVKEGSSRWMRDMGVAVVDSTRGPSEVRC